MLTVPTQVPLAARRPNWLCAACMLVGGRRRDSARAKPWPGLRKEPMAPYSHGVLSIRWGLPLNGSGLSAGDELAVAQEGLITVWCSDRQVCGLLKTRLSALMNVKLLLGVRQVERSRQQHRHTCRPTSSDSRRAVMFHRATAGRRFMWSNLFGCRSTCGRSPFVISGFADDIHSEEIGRLRHENSV